MEIVVSRNILAQELSLLSASLEQKGTIPILSFVLVEPSESGIRLTATDLDVGLSVDVPAERNGDEPFCLPAHELRETLRYSTAESVSVTVDAKERAQVRAGSARCNLPTASKDSFPVRPECDDQAVEAIPAEALARMVSSTVYSVADQIGKWAFQCARLSVSDGVLSALAMDGCRFAYAARPATAGAAISAMIPRRAYGVLGKFAKESSGDVLFSANKNHGFFRCGSRYLWTRQSVEDFPDVRTMLAQPFTHSMSSAVDDLGRCTKGAAVFTFRIPRLKYSFTRHGLTVEGQDRDKGEGAQSVTADIPSLNGDEINIGLNGKYVLDFLSCNAGEIAVDFSDGNNMVRFRPKEAPDLCDSKYYLVPMRLD